MGAMMHTSKYGLLIALIALNAISAPACAQEAVPTLGIGTVEKPAKAPSADQDIGIGTGAATTAPAPPQPQMTVTMGAVAAKDKWAVGDPAGDMLNSIAAHFGVILVAPKFSAVMLRAGALPKTLEDAVTMARDNLEPQGWGIVQTVSGKPDPHVILRVVPLKQAQDAQVQSGPVTSGDDASVIDLAHPGEPITHLMKVNHPEMLDRLRETATQDKDVSVDLVGSARGGYTLILSGPAAKIKTAVAAVATLDKATDQTPSVKAMKLMHLDAVSTALTLNANFQQQGKEAMRAVADRRTNTIILSGPEDDVVSEMVTLISMDLAGKGGAADKESEPTTPAPPAPAPGPAR